MAFRRRPRWQSRAAGCSSWAEADSISEPSRLRVSPRARSAYRRHGPYSRSTSPFATGLEGLGTVNLDRVFRSSDSGRTWERITSDSDSALRERPVVDAI